MNFVYKFMCLIVIASTLTACNMMTLKPSTFDSIKSVSVDSNVAMPNGAFFHGGASNLASMGLVGSLISEADRSKDATVTDLLNPSNPKGINVGSIFYSEFKEALDKSSISSKISEDSPVKFKLTINSYGLGKALGFSNDMRPSMNITVKLLREDKTVIWEKWALIGGASPSDIPTMKLEEWQKSPELLEKAFHQACQMVVGKMLADLK